MCVLDDRRQDDRRRKRGGGEAADQPVEPQAHAQLAQVRTQQQHDRHVQARVHRQVQPISRRDAAGGRAGAFDEQGKIEFAQAPAEQPRAHCQPRRALLLERDATGDHGERRAEYQHVVDAVVDQPVGAVPAEAGGHVQHKHSQSSQQEGEQEIG